jgi:ribosomal protein L37AE/L43A
MLNQSKPLTKKEKKKLKEDYQCPKCKEMSLKFEPTGKWD